MGFDPALEIDWVQGMGLVRTLAASVVVVGVSA